MSVPNPISVERKSQSNIPWSFSIFIMVLVYKKVLDTVKAPLKAPILKGLEHPIILYPFL